MRISILHKNTLIVLALLLPLLFLTGPSFGRLATAEKGLTMTVTPIPVTNSFWNGEAALDNGALYAQAAGGTAPYNYTLEALNISDNNGYFTLLPPGTYTVRVTDANGQTTTASAIITSTYPIPSLNISNVVVPTSCLSADGSFTFVTTNGTPPYQYSIDGGVTWTTKNVFTNLRGGQYVCLVRDANNMEAVVLTNPNTFFSTGAVTFFPASCPLQIFADGFGNPSCPGSYGGSLSVDALGGTHPYTWSFDNITYQPAAPGYGAPNGDLFQNLKPGFYTIYVKDANGNMAIGNTSVTAYCDVVFSSVTSDASCHGGSDGSMTLTPADGMAPYTYTMDGIHYQSSNIFTGLAAGFYNVTAMDAIGHWKSGFVTIKSDCPLQLTITNTVNATCSDSNGSVTVTASYGTAPYVYSRDGASFQSSNTFTDLSAGNYTLTVRDFARLIATAPVTLTNAPGPLLDTATQPVSCANTNGMITLTATGGTAPLQYSIDGGASFQPTGDFNGLKSGNYSALVRDFNGCTAAAPVPLTALPVPAVSLGSDITLCNGQTTVLTAPSGYTYLWQDNSTTPNYTVSQPGSYSVTVTNSYGCDTSASIKVSYITAPVVNLGNDTTICVTQELVLNASYPLSEYLWQDGSATAGYNVSQAGLYTVTVTNNCGSTNDSIRVSYENCACKFYIPNAFSPNNDGNNDVFKPKYSCLFSNYECMLFNRWGQPVFSSQNPADGWDGTFKGQVQPPGVYVWVIRYKDDLTGKQMKKTGTVILIR